MAEKENPAVQLGKSAVSSVASNVGKGLLSGKGFSLGSLFGPALPFSLLAGFVASKLINDIFGDKPRITFSGVDPKYFIPDEPGRDYVEIDREVTGKGGKSQKYDYVIAVKDTGKDEEIAQALIQQYDAAFDALAEQGVPVNEMLQRNKNFISSGRVDKGMDPEKMFTNVMAHFQPDVEAYKSGVVPPPRNITVKPKSDPTKGREEFDAGILRNKYQVTIDNDGTKVQTDGMKPIDMVRNPNLSPADLLAATGGTTQADLDVLYAKALAGDPKKYAKDDYHRRVRQFQAALAGNNILRNIPGDQPWFSDYAQNRDQIFTQASEQLAQRNALPEYSPQARFKPQEYLNQNPDVADAGYTEDTAYQHFDRFGRTEQRPGSPLAVGEYSFKDAETAKNYLQSRTPDKIKKQLSDVGGTEAELASVVNRLYGAGWTEEDVKNYLDKKAPEAPKESTPQEPSTPTPQEPSTPTPTPAPHNTLDSLVPAGQRTTYNNPIDQRSIGQGLLAEAGSGSISGIIRGRSPAKEWYYKR